MAYDGDITDYVTKPDVFSVHGLRDWLMTQDGATEYDFRNIRDCLNARFHRALGREYFVVAVEVET